MIAHCIDVVLIVSGLAGPSDGRPLGSSWWAQEVGPWIARIGGSSFQDCAGQRRMGKDGWKICQCQWLQRCVSPAEVFIMDEI